MSRAMWLSGGGVLAGLALWERERRNEAAEVFELSGLRQLELLQRSASTPRVVAIIGPAGPAARAFGVTFGRPLPRAVITGGWGDGRAKKVGGSHYGIDMPAATGTPITAVTSGTVAHVDAAGKSTAGKYVVVRQGDVATRYLHMSKVTARVGERIDRGAVIGLVGSTGFSSSPHLHLDVFFSDLLLAEFVAQHGEPTPTFRTRRWGIHVPAETLIPVDSYTRRVRTAASKRGVHLLSDVIA